jgi:hypothetical protein
VISRSLILESLLIVDCRLVIESRPMITAQVASSIPNAQSPINN